MVAIFWDYENCNPPSNTSGYLVVRQLRNVAQRFGPVKLFKAYLDFSQFSSVKTISLRSELQTSGVSLTDCPHNGKKDVADNMILVDMLSYAMDNPPPSPLILITGDRDFAYAVAMLRLRQYCVVVVAPTTPKPHISLRSQASVLLSWNLDVLSQIEKHSNANPPNHNDSLIPGSHASQSRPTRRSSVTLGPPPSSPREDISDTITDTWTNGSMTMPDVSVSAKELLLQTLHPVADAPSNLNDPEDWDDLSQDGYCGNPYQEGEGLLEDNWTEIRSQSDDLNSPTHVIAEAQYSSSTSSTSDVVGTVEETFVVDDEFIDVNILATFKPPERPSSAPPGSASVTRMYDTLHDVPQPRPSTTSESGIQLAGQDILPCRHEDQQTDEGISGSKASAALPFEPDLSKPCHEVASGPNLQIVQISTPTATICPPVTASVIPYSPHTPSSSSMKEASPPPNEPSFSTLVDILKAAHQKGFSLPTRSSVAALLLRREPTVYQRSGVKGFNEYTALAHEAGLVELGAVPNGETWVRLRVDLPDVRAEAPPHKFAVLIDILNESGHERPSRSNVATSLQKRAPKVIQQAGATTFRRYCALAEAAGIIELGLVNNGDAWMALKPRWRKVK